MSFESLPFDQLPDLIDDIFDIDPQELLTGAEAGWVEEVLELSPLEYEYLLIAICAGFIVGTILYIRMLPNGKIEVRLQRET